MWTTRSPGVRRSRMSRGTTRRRARGRRTRTVPKSSRSVTKLSPSGPPAKPPFRLRSTRVRAPGGGASATRSTIATGWPASPSSSASRGAWSEARTIRAPSARQPSTASTRRPARPAGRVGSCQPNGSPEDSPPRAIAASSAGRTPRSARASATRRAGPSSRAAAGTSTASPWAGRPRRPVRSRRSSAWRHRNAAASAMSPGSSRTRSVPGSRWSRPVAGARCAAQTSAASPTLRARLVRGP